MKHLPRLHTLALAALALLQQPAHAIINGIVPSMATDAPAIVNPFTGQATDAWKLVGRLTCSAFQISREWVIEAGHCSVGGGTATFTGHLGTSPVQYSDCYKQGADDFQLCRLKNPENMTPLASYPPMVALPSAWRDDSVNGVKYGSVMGYGHASLGDGLAFVGLDGFPQNFEAAAPKLTPVPFTSGGDSGGAAYWFPVGSAKAHMVGILVSASTVSGSPFYFREDNLAWIKSTIAARGDVPPDMPAISSVFTPSTSNPAPRLSAQPTLTRSGNTNTVTLQWSTPSASPAVSTFKVTLGRGGALESSFNAAPGASSNQVTLNLSAPDKYTFCARAYNAIGASEPGFAFLYLLSGQLYSPNCLDIDNRDNLSTITGLATTGNTAVSSQISVGFSWSANIAPADLKLAGYRVTQVVSYPTGPSRTSTITTAAQRVSVLATKGSKVCVSVSALSSAYKTGPVSSQVCTMAN